jgi:ACR3 family arsenite transporter
MKALQDHLNKWLLLYVLAAMSLGLALGHPMAEWVKQNSSLLSNVTNLAVFLIIYPMMINLKIEAMLKASKNIKGILLAVAYNFLWSPLLGWILAHAFLTDPLLALGFLLVMVVPCSSMSIGYTGLAEGNLELATVVVAMSFILAIVAVPIWMTIFASNYQVPLPIRDLIMSMFTVLIAPMVLGYLTRQLLTRTLGKERFKDIQPLFPSLSLMAMYGIVFLIFFAKASMIIDKWQTVLLLVVPNALFIVITLVVGTWINKQVGLSYRDHMAIIFASTGKNNGTAIAIATTAFSPLVAIPAATMPIFQIILLVLYLKLAPRIEDYFKSKKGVAAIPKSAT